MRDRTEGTARGAIRPLAIRYLPATLAAVAAASCLVAFPPLTSWTRPWFYGMFLKGAGPPPESRLTLLVTPPDTSIGGTAAEAATLGRLVAALLDLQPAVLALELPAGLPSFPIPSHHPASVPLVLGGDLRAPVSEPVPASPFAGEGPTRQWPAFTRLDPDDRLRLPLAAGLDLPTPWPGRHATGAFTTPLAPASGAAYAFPAFAATESGPVAALGVEAARRGLGAPAASITYVEGVGVLVDSTHMLPVDGEGRLFLRFHAAGGIPAARAADVLAGTVSAEDVRGRVVVVAGSGRPPVRTAAGLLSSAEIQATAAANLLEKTSVSAPSWGSTLSVTLGIAFAAIVLTIHFADIGLLMSLSIAALLAALYPALSMWLFVKSSWWLPPELPAFLVPAAWLPFAATRLLSGRGSRAGKSSRTPGAGAARPAPIFDPAVDMGGGPMRSAHGVPGASGAPARAIPPGGIPGTGPAVPAPAAAAGTAASAGGDDIERDPKGGGLVRIGKYRIVRKMGFGSGGDVFEGFDTHMGRKVAIKTITKDAAAHFDHAAERFVVEAKAAGSLNHPCINTIHDFGTIRDISYMVLEHLDGVTLSQWMRQNPIPSPREAAHWIQQICSALDYAHSHKVIHRDIKPANLMVVHGGATIKLLDFGIAKLEDVGLTRTGTTVGTPSYMSPEQLMGTKVTPASDQYSLAVVLYQLFTYKLPYQGTRIPELCNRILKNELIPITEVNPSLGVAFWEALRKAFSKVPEERHPSCMALCQALEAASPARDRH